MKTALFQLHRCCDGPAPRPLRQALLLVVLLAAVAVSESGCRRAPNRGDQWTAGPRAGTLDLFCVALSGDQLGWAVGDIDPAGAGGVIYKTSDGGRTWLPVAKTAEILTAVQFISPATGWVAGYSGRIQRTDDGGKTWQVQRDGPEEQALNSLCFLDDHRGWACGNGGLVVRTTDGGRTWSDQPTGRVEDLWCVRFASADRGWAVGEGGLILATADGGVTWAPQNSGTSVALMSLAIADSGVGIAAGGSGTIVRCADGSSWSLVRAGGAEELNGIAAAGDVMCVVGSEGVRLSSQDGGLTWAEAAGRPAGDLIAVALTKSGNGIAVGRRGLTEIHLK